MLLILTLDYKLQQKHISLNAYVDHFNISSTIIYCKDLWNTFIYYK